MVNKSSNHDYYLTHNESGLSGNFYGILEDVKKELMKYVKYTRMNPPFVLTRYDDCTEQKVILAKGREVYKDFFQVDMTESNDDNK